MVQKNEKGQAIPSPTVFIGPEAFEKQDQTTIYWLGNAGIHINSRGTNLMLDPLLEGFDMPVLIDAPIAPKNIPTLDGILITVTRNL